MTYTIDSKPPCAETEIDLLQRGFNYMEIARMTGARQWSISERNRIIYKIDIWEAFKGRIERDGIPNRLTAPDEFCNWFTGFFDGEGSIIVFTRPTTGNPKYFEYRLGIRIEIRDDDISTITRIKDNLKVGRIHFHKRNGASNPAVSWNCEKVDDLAEVIIPLFDNHPLYTKKVKEYVIWKPLVIQRYIDTLGGYSNRHRIPDEHRIAFKDAIKAISEIRTYRVRIA